jgi:hypothetical protein
MLSWSSHSYFGLRSVMERRPKGWALSLGGFSAEYSPENGSRARCSALISASKARISLSAFHRDALSFPVSFDP